MIVTKIEPCTKTKFKIYIDETFKFVLYKGEVSRFGIRIGEEIPPETEEKIRTEVLLKRAKLRAMHLLEDMDRTESALREKLRQGLYPSDVTEAAIEYVKSFGYLDDVRYAENFVRSRQNVKSKKEIGTALLQKGISSEIAKRAMEICYEEMGEEEAIRIIRDKRLTDLAAKIVPYRNVLQVRIGRAEASGRCYRLVERGMYLSGLRIDQLG